MSKCNDSHTVNSSVYQTLEELDFERGIWHAAQTNDIPRVLSLIKKGVNVNVTDKSGYTALHYASRNGHFELCKLLLSYEADVNSVTKTGRASSLHRTASVGHLEIIKLLLNSGAKTDLKDADGKTVLHRAAEADHENIVSIILEVNPSLAKEPDKKGDLPSHLTASDSIKSMLSQFEIS